MLGITDDTEKRNTNRKRKKKGVSFNEDDEIINPEDIDPSVGRFRNLVQTTVIPATIKRQKLNDSIGIPTSEFKSPRTIQSTVPGLYQDLPPPDISTTSSSMSIYSSLSSRLGMVLPNPAPDVDMGQGFTQPTPFVPPAANVADSLEPKKKKYAKEAWPGKKPAPTLLV